ncbi:MAG: hypothetical protein ABI664_18555 [bacterium]
MLLTFTDQSGTSWDVFEVYPTEERTVSRVPAAFRSGWLCFQSDLERRRLAPIPFDWRNWDVETLTAALLATHGIPRRTPRRSFEVASPSRRTSGESAIA